MKDLQEATEKICELKGECFALQSVLNALLRSLPAESVNNFVREFAQSSEIARVTIINSGQVGESVIASFDQHAQNWTSMAQKIAERPAPR